VATKSVIDIEIKDQAFKEFLALFEKYQAQLKKMPGAWGKVGDATKNSAKGFEGATAALLKAADAMNNLVKSQEKLNSNAGKFNKHLKDSERSFSSITKKTAEIGKSVAGTTLNLLKWVGVGSAFGLLGAAGGLFGLAGLATSASNTRRQAQELGVSPGQLKAANVNFGRYGDVGGLLSGISGAQTDLSKQWAFGASGLNANESSANLLPQILRKAAEVYKSGPAATAGQRLEVSGLTQFGVTVQQARQYASLTKEEIELAERRYKQDSAQLELNDKTLRRWQDLDVQLGRSREKIENTFITLLEKLAPQIEVLSDKFAGAVESFLKNPKMGEYIDMFSKKIGEFAEYLASDKFKTDVNDFLKSVEDIARALSTLAKFINDMTDDFLGVKGTREAMGIRERKEGDVDFEARNPNWNDLKQMWKGTQGKLKGVSPDLAQAIWNAGLTPISGVRTEEEEAKLRHHQINGQWYTKEGRLAAAPGKSPHLKGSAVDIDPTEAEKISDEELAKYGLWRPYGRKDYNHIELLPPEKRKKADDKVGMNNWNPTPIQLSVNTTKIPGQDNDINILNAGGYYTGLNVRAG